MQISDVDSRTFLGPLVDNHAKGSAAAGMNGDGFLRPAEPLKPPASTATTLGAPSLLPNNGELSSQNYSPSDGGGVREPQGTVAPPGDAAEARAHRPVTWKQMMRTLTAGVGLHAAGTTRDGDETLLLRTGAVEMIEMCMRLQRTRQLLSMARSTATKRAWLTQRHPANLTQRLLMRSQHRTSAVSGGGVRNPP